MNDPINPAHYKHLPVEAIEIIEAAIERAPTNAAAYHQGQVLKYLLRCWEKKGIEDLRKAKWYLDRLVDSFDEAIAEASEANEPSREPTKRYREPTLEDLKNGPIECKVGDRHEKRTLIYVFENEPGRARFATVDEANPNCVGRWIDCRIEVTE